MSTLWEVFANDDEPPRHACAGEHCQVCRINASPSLPYAGTSGWSGSDTSRERAVRDDKTGVTGRRQAKLLGILAERGNEGITWRELSQITGDHHGTASGALSVLHKEGRIDRLTVRRGRCKVYVLPEFVNGRQTESHGRSKSCPNCGHEL